MISEFSKNPFATSLSHVVSDASRPFGPAESSLVAYMKQKHEKNTETQTAAAQLTALLGSKSSDGVLLPYLPPLIVRKIASHLGTAAQTSLTELWGSRLNPVSRNAMLQKAAKIYGFISHPEAGDWQTHLENLALPLRWLPSIGEKPDAVLAGLLLGKFRPYQALRECPDNREVVMRVIEQENYIFDYFQYASAALRDDLEVVMCAVEQAGQALRFASARLQNNRKVVMCAIKHDGEALKHASETLQADREVVMYAIGQNGRALRYASATLQADREVVLRAVKQNGWGLQYASVAFQDDREVVTHAIDHDGLSLQFASATLRADRELVISASKKHGWALMYASEALRDDREVVMCAVGQDGRALEFASETLRSDREMVMHAIQQDGWGLEYAAEALQNDPDLRKLAKWRG